MNEEKVIFISKRGRPNKYYQNVVPRWDDIEKWCRLGIPEKQIAKNLDIGVTHFCEYKKRHPELAEHIRKSRQSPVIAIKGALYKRATGFHEQEITTITKTNKDGETHTEVRQVTKYYPPDPASCMILLKQWAKSEGWTNDPQMLKLKEKELKLKQEQFENNNW